MAGFVVALVAATSPGFSSSGGVVTGKLSSSNSMDAGSAQRWGPVEGAYVHLVNVFTSATIAATHSDTAGEFSFTSIAPGDYGVEVLTKDACALSNVIHVTADSKTVVQLRLKHDLCAAGVQFAVPNGSNGEL